MKTKRIISMILCVIMIVSFALSASALKSVAIKGITLDKTSITLKAGQSYSLKISLSPANTTQKLLKFTSDNKNVASIDLKGKIMAVKAGKAVITVMSTVNAKVLAKCTVTVTQTTASATPKPATPKPMPTYSPGKVISISYAGVNSPFEDGSWGQKYLEDKFKVKIEVVRIEVDNYMATLNLRFASGQAPDLMSLPTPNDYASLAVKNLLAPMSEVLIKTHMPKYHAMATGMDPDIFRYTMIKGKNYGLLTVSATGSWNFPIAMRADWIKNVGGFIPRTLKEFEDLFIKFRENDPDKNGKKDTYALTAPTQWGPDYMFAPIFGAFGTNPNKWFVRDGKMVYGFTEQGTKEALKTLAKWYKMELIDPEFITNKARTNSNDDISFKFASGRVGYIDHYWFDDHTNDASGQISGKWVANHPEWKAWFDKHKGQADEFSLKSMTSLTAPEGFPQPYYINAKPPIGPTGKSGTIRPGVAGGRVYALSKNTDEEKMVRVLQMYEALSTDKDAFFSYMGPEGKAWKYSDDKSYRVSNPNWKQDQDYHPQGRNLGTGWWINPFQQSNPAFLKGWGTGSPSMKQRYELSANINGVAVGYPGIENALKGSLASAGNYPEITNGNMIKEYMVKAITGAVDIDATFDDFVKKWNDNGGSVLTKEANDWLKSIN